MALGGHRDRSRPFEVAVDAVTLQRLLDGVEVLPAESGERLDLVRPALGAVGMAVRDRRGTKAAVASAGRPPDPVPLEQDHLAGGVALLGQDRRPKTRVT